MSADPIRFTAADWALAKEALIAECRSCRGQMAYCLDHAVDAATVLAALADAGRLTPADAEVAEQWTYAQPGWPDGPLVALHWDHVFDSQREAEEQLGHYRLQVPGRDWSGVCIARRVTIEGPWVAADGTPECDG